MNKLNFLIAVFCISTMALAQVGIGTANPQGTFHVDGAADNVVTGTPTTAQQANDFLVKSNGQVGIGTISPDESTIIDIKSNTKGIGFPIVSLTSSTLDIDGVPGQKTGLVVYNPGTVNVPQGIFYWNGTEWRYVNNSTSVAPSIDALDCSRAVASPKTFTNGTPYSGTLSVPYSGGNGGVYAAGTTFTQHGLNFTLQQGTLSYGNGSVTYNVIGIPNFSSPDTRNVLIDFLGESCFAEIGFDQEVKTLQFTRKVVSPIPSDAASAQAATTTVFGNIAIRYSGNFTDGIQITSLVNTHMSWFSELGGGGAPNSLFAEYNTTNSIAGTWVNWGHTFNPFFRDFARITITLHNTNEIYRVSALVNDEITDAPTDPSTIIFFIEKLD